jgi:phosphatidylserine/phosphatidylglycerophosphate/cardiolipin synthase-like enzyme
VLDVRAIGGLHVVTLAWDFAEGQAPKLDGLMGFAIERAELRKGEVFERYYLRGIKRFKDVDLGLPPGTPVSTAEHPVQSFQWGDYTAKPRSSYEYKVVPVYGKPKCLRLDEASATTVAISTEAEEDAREDGRAGHQVYFNRGAAGSQAYARRFPDPKPDPDDPESEQMKWLSRGLFEGLLGFIGRASGADAPRCKLRAMLYEFSYLPVGKAFAAARRAGADVDIRYEAQSYRKDNEEMIAAAKIKGICAPQRSRAGIRHNKFIVLVKDDRPVAVWTGSTNISAGGIFGHSNVGHAVWDEAVAGRFLDYWERLAAEDAKRADLAAANLEVEPTAGLPPPDDRILTFFSPRDGEESLETLQWYADLMGSAQRILCMTFAFSLDPRFAKVLERPGGALKYAAFDKDIADDVETRIDAAGNSIIAVGAKFGKDDLENFRAEVLTGFNRNRYIHDKFMLVDPLSDDPIVVTGTANFSPASQSANDENMLVIRGDRRVADIYFGEFMRIFDHLYARYLVKKLKAEKREDPEAGYLKVESKDWAPAHFREGRKKLRRVYFMG